ncbi:MAG TPA: hypothetical protein VIL95_06415 [Bacillota bacterium]
MSGSQELARFAVRPKALAESLVLRGRGHAQVGGERIELEPGVLAYVSPPPGPDDHRGVEEGLRAGR